MPRSCAHRRRAAPRHRPARLPRRRGCGARLPPGSARPPIQERAAPWEDPCWPMLRAVAVEAAQVWLGESAFHAFLGLEVLEISPDRLRLRLPFDERLTNNGAVLHGGIAAALAGVTSRALWLASGGEGTAHTASLHVSYVAAAEEDLAAEAFLVRAGRNVCFTRTALVA